MSKPEKHKMLKRSWWDGSVTSYCGMVAPSGSYTEMWLTGQTTCPACLAAKKASQR